MLANHTKISSLFERGAKEFDKLFRKKAFLEQFKKEEIFSESFSELEKSREAVENLVEEYKAATKPDYIDWSTKQS